jgi:hypothetical protein
LPPRRTRGLSRLGRRARRGRHLGIGLAQGAVRGNAKCATSREEVSAPSGTEGPTGPSDSLLAEVAPLPAERPAATPTTGPRGTTRTAPPPESNAPT